MKAEELRIGNYFSHNGNIHIVSEILQDCINEVVPSKTGGHYNLYEFMYKEIEPIPLTEEWLVKNGMGEDFWFKCLGYLVEYEDGWYLSDNETGTTNAKPFKYIHTFQNFYFAITGEELEVK